MEVQRVSPVRFGTERRLQKQFGMFIANEMWPPEPKMASVQTILCDGIYLHHTQAFSSIYDA